MSFILLFLIGCATDTGIHISVGRIYYSGTPVYNMHKLGELKQGIATVQDVRNMMGEPSGYGKVRIKPDSELLDVWFYQYMETKRSQAILSVALIFIDKNEIYKGHMAFIPYTFAK
jgi:hypothetical protein